MKKASPTDAEEAFDLALGRAGIDQSGIQTSESGHPKVAPTRDYCAAYTSSSIMLGL